ncbi:extracellular solute-binding protein [Amylibacter sp.]|nr:extracellular solute-binding protein [Amylibacter sp.]
MKDDTFMKHHSKLKAFISILFICIGTSTLADAKHGIAMYGEPDLPQDFVSLPYVNTNAPQGGRLIFGERGGFDSFNPFILKGKAPYGIKAHTFETLLGRSYDEPFTLYGLLAESVETSETRDWVEFTLRKEARFSDNTPVTIEDVIWSYETLGTVGHPRYVRSWGKVLRVEKTGERSVRFYSDSGDQELPLILGLRPILKKSDFDNRDFATSSMKPITGSGPYVIDKYEAGRFIQFKKNPNYWGNDIAFNRGRHNISELRYDYYLDSNVIFEAFKAGDISYYREGNGSKWENNYNFDRINSGKAIKSIVPHKRPSGMKGLAINTRKNKFSDWRVREALIQAFDYENFNEKVYGGTKIRYGSFFSNSKLGMSHEPASGRVKELLEEYKSSLLPGAIEGYSYPVSDGKRNRKGLRKATQLLSEAGWNLDNGLLKNSDGKIFEIEIMLQNNASELEAISNIYVDSLKRLGINVTIASLDSAVFRERKKSYDFDMMPNLWWLSLSPGNEQKLYWGPKGITEPGTRNYMGAKDTAIEPLIDHMLTATDQSEFVAAVKALDRILTAGRYVVPFGYDNVSRLAHDSTMKFPERLPMYGDWTGFLPDVWWVE